MSRLYRFAFSAPGDTSAKELQDFLYDVEHDAKAMGFNPVLVIDAVFDSPEGRKFARQLTTGAHIETEDLKGVVILQNGQVWSHDNVNGSCRVIPKRAVILVVTNEDDENATFGFLQYPETLVDVNGKEVVKTGQGERWIFQNFVDSPDARYRKIVKQFSEAGYLDSEKDEFQEGPGKRI